MKKSILSAAIAASTAALMSSGAMAWDSFEWDGGASKEYHHTKGVFPGDAYGPGTPTDPGCAPGNLCDTLAGPQGVEASSFIIINNKTLGAKGPNNTPQQEDCYTFLSSDYDASGNPDPGAANFGDYQSILRTDTHLWIPSLAPTAPGIITQNTENPDTYPDIHDICTDAEGKITGGWYGFFALNPLSQPRFVITDWDQNWSIGFGNGTTGTQFQSVPTIAEVKTILTDVIAGNVPAAGYTGYGPLGDWEVTGVAQVAYETCDPNFECGQFGKSVPVPAFAAAALGLGLLGITYLTGRRRAIK